MIMTTPEKTRKALSHLMKEYDRAEDPNHTTFRNLVYSFSVILQFFKLEKDLEIEKEIEEIKARLSGVSDDPTI